ncbi:MAG TPA: hypothetical protein GX736_06685 [Mogibacterium sp.]|nr:hypothetical protein [Mogibacterium sp.]
MNRIKQEMSGYRLPMYIEEILTNNYCPHFLKMSMIREDERYVFNYTTERYKKINIDALDTYMKMLLLRSIIVLNERNKEWLIKAENYLIEPELIYSVNNIVDEKFIKILFYPDFKKMKFEHKIIIFAEKIKDKNDKEESNLINTFKTIAEKGDMNRVKIFLDKNISRIENRIASEAS